MHVLADLSAYLDQELAPAERARVSSHLQDCGRCAARLAELRATATLISALPSAKPSRSLVPSVAPRLNWLRPMRSLSAVASGAFLMVFLVSAVAQSGSNLGGGPTSPFGGTAAQPAAAPQAAPGAADARLAATAAPTAREEATAAVAPAAAPAPQATDAAQQERGLFSATATAEAKAVGPDEVARTTAGLDRPQAPSPLIWLLLAILAAAIAGVTHWRLRAA